MRVDGRGAVAHEAAEREPPVVGELDRERRRRADGHEHGTPGDGRLLHELEREPSADAEHLPRERQHALDEGPADDLVHGVVPADVLPDAPELAVRGEEAGRMEAAGQVEGRLRGPQPPGERGHDVEGDREIAVDARRIDGDGLERALAADAARRRGVERALHPREVRAGRVDLHDVRGEVGGSDAPRPGAEPSVRQNPSASSSSCPGVRIVTATAVPSTRISSGSSTASRSASATPPGSRVTVARDVPWGTASMAGA